MKHSLSFLSPHRPVVSCWTSQISTTMGLAFPFTTTNSRENILTFSIQVLIVHMYDVWDACVLNWSLSQLDPMQFSIYQTELNYVKYQKMESKSAVSQY